MYYAKCTRNESLVMVLDLPARWARNARLRAPDAGASARPGCECPGTVRPEHAVADRAGGGAGGREDPWRRPDAVAGGATGGRPESRNLWRSRERPGTGKSGI